MLSVNAVLINRGVTAGKGGKRTLTQIHFTATKLLLEKKVSKALELLENNICLQETEMQYRNQPWGSFWEEISICSYTPLVPQGRAPFALSGHTQGSPTLPDCPKKLLPPTTAQAKNYSTCSTFLCSDTLNHFQLPNKLRCLTDGFKALSFMVHYQDLVNRNRLFLPACEGAAECFISGNAAYKYDSVILWNRTSRNCFPLCKLAAVILFWT